MSIDAVIQKRSMMAGRPRLMPLLTMAAGFGVFTASGVTAGAQYTAVDLCALQIPAGTYGPQPVDSFGGEVVGDVRNHSYGFQVGVIWNPDGSAVAPPSGFPLGTDGSRAFGVEYVALPPLYNTETGEPVVWSGSAASATFLDMGGFYSATVAGSDGGQFVGYGNVQNSGPPHALLWNSLTAKPIDLSPTNLVGIVNSYANGTSGSQQVGYGSGFDANNTSYSHALLWTGTANSAVDLNPTNLPGSVDSYADATDGQQQVGYGILDQAYIHAFLWSGSANSAVDLNPSGFSVSHAYGVLNGKQVGDGVGTDGLIHALVWSGTAASAVDLETFLPTTLVDSTAYSIDDAGDVWGIAFNSSDHQCDAIEWLPVAAIAGDYNQDGVVDAADYIVWRKGLGTTYTQQDYDLWRANFGQTAGSGTAIASATPLSAAVPEPASLGLLAVGALALLGRRNRRTCHLPASRFHWEKMR